MLSWPKHWLENGPPFIERCGMANLGHARIGAGESMLAQPQADLSSFDDGLHDIKQPQEMHLWADGSERAFVKADLSERVCRPGIGGAHLHPKIRSAPIAVPPLYPTVFACFATQDGRFIMWISTGKPVNSTKPPATTAT